MKIISLLLSAVTLMYLSSAIFVDQDTDSDARSYDKKVTLINIAKNSKQLEIERDWIPKPANNKTKKPTKNKVIEKVVKKVVDNTPTLIISGVKYKLLGIFSKSAEPFIVLQDSKSTLLKVLQGQEISPGNILETVYSDRVAVKTNETVIEFKLFELKKNA